MSLSRFIYNRTKDTMRSVSSHVSIGRAARDGKAMDNCVPSSAGRTESARSSEARKAELTSTSPHARAKRRRADVNESTLEQARKAN